MIERKNPLKSNINYKLRPIYYSISWIVKSISQFKLFVSNWKKKKAKETYEILKLLYTDTTVMMNIVYKWLVIS